MSQMNDKNLFYKLQNDIVKSSAKIISTNDNESTIRRKFNSKYTENISDSEGEKNDSDDDLASYKNRNSDIIGQIKKTNKINKPKRLKQLKKLNKMEQLEQIEEPNQSEEQDNSNGSGFGSGYEYEFAEEFTNKVKQYVGNDDRIKELQNELKTLNNIKKAAEIEILKHLERMGETTITITGGKLRVNQYESKEGLKEDIIKEVLVEKIQDPKIIEAIFEKINEKRVAGGKMQRSLKRTSERAKDEKKK